MEKVNIEMDISKEEDNLLKYQLKKDYVSVRNCRERLENLYSTLRNIENKIEELESDGETNLTDSIKASNNLPKLGVSDIPIDDGTATFTFTATSETLGSKEGKKVYVNHEQKIQKTYKVEDGDIVSETVTETSKTQKEIKKNDEIEVKAKSLK